MAHAAEADRLEQARAGLAVARAALAEGRVRLLVDFVPNHVAPDHPWLTDHPDLVRFLENHDDPRVAAELTPEKERSASVVIAALPSATMWHEGQFEGWRVRLPVFLGRRPEEPVDADLQRFSLELVGAVADRRRGYWQLCDASGWPDDQSYQQLLARSWFDDEQRTLVVVNFADAPAAAHVALPWDDLAGRTWRLVDLLTSHTFVRDGGDVANSGLYVQLPPFGFHVFAWGHEPSETV